MAILNIGSINCDHVYQLDSFPKPGETIAARSVSSGLGGKGLNQSVAILRSGGNVKHCGAIGANDPSMNKKLEEIGLSLDWIATTGSESTGSAIILLDENAENCIILNAGANRVIQKLHIKSAIGAMDQGDWLLVQNETNGLEFAIDTARGAGLKVVLAAAPFDADIVLPLLDRIDLLAVNEIEYQQIVAALGGEKHFPHKLALFLTKGARGIEYHFNGNVTSVEGIKISPVDTTGAGDTALGAFLARLDIGENINSALQYAVAASALQVTRKGAVNAIPYYDDVMAFIDN